MHASKVLDTLAFGHFLVYFWPFVKVLIGNNLLLQVQSAKFRFLFQVTQFECDPISSIVWSTVHTADIEIIDAKPTHETLKLIYEVVR